MAGTRAYPYKGFWYGGGLLPPPIVIAIKTANGLKPIRTVRVYLLPPPIPIKIYTADGLKPIRTLSSPTENLRKVVVVN